MVHESQDKRPQTMTVSSGFPASGVPTLPSFRELLPDYLHDEIDRAASRSQPDHQQGGGSCSSPRQNLPLRHRSTPRGGHPSARPPSRDPRYDDVSSRPDRFMSSGDHSRYHGSPTLPRAHPLGSKSHHTSSLQSSHGYPPRDMNRSLPPIPNLQTSPSDTRSPFSNSSDRSPSGPMSLHRPMKKESERDLFAHSSTSPSSMFGSPSSLEPPNLYPTPPLSLPKPMEPTSQLSPYSPYPPTSYSSEREYSPRLSNAMHSSSLGSPGDSGSDMREKKRRGNLPKQVTDMLRAWLWEHLEHPYPSEEDKQMFIHQTGLTINQISNWFINARRRQLPGLREQAQNGSTGDTRNSSPMNSDSGRESTDMYHTRLSDA